MRVELLDHGYLSLVETWGSDERIVEAARMSTGTGRKPARREKGERSDSVAGHVARRPALLATRVPRCPPSVLAPLRRGVPP